MSLSPREEEVLKLYARLFTRAEIGSRLQISARTVDVHLYRAKGKVGLDTLRDVVRYAIQKGWMGMEEFQGAA
jgi:DNA-binding CsgD family transcriptional regulator